MSDDEVIKFEITDYDLDNEFSTNRGRRAKKEQQIYGVWAKDSDEEDNEDNIRKRIRKKKDYSAPIGFVAGGIQQAGKKKETNKESDALQPSEGPSHVVFDDSSDEDGHSEPDARDTAGIRRQGQGMRPVSLGGSMGSWEKHTKGIGAKLLLQMGYQPGKGLGKDLQGISAPVEASVRKGRGAIGAYGPEKAALKAKKEEEKRLKEKEKAEAIEGQKSYHWKKSHKGRYFYRDAADVIQEGKPSMQTTNSNSLTCVPVIDMTGRERRVLSGYHALRSAAPRFEHEPRRECRNFAMPELAHNLDIMVECCEQDIIQNARELQQAEDEIVVLERDLAACDIKLSEHDVVINKVQSILERVQELTRPEISLEMAFVVLENLTETYPLEYEMFGLGRIVGNIISPLLSAGLAKWDPLQNPEQPVDTFLKWRPLLVEEAYTALLWQHYVPHITAAAETWNPREPQAMLTAIESWSSVCPQWVIAECVSRAVVPRLVTAVRDWDPTRDTQPLHVWVLPWHNIAGTALSSSVYPLIRSRLATALGAWHPADGSALPLLEAWRDAWGPALTSLLHHHIVPKLEACLQSEPIELLAGENVAWQWCLPWLGVVGANTIGTIATRAFLPRWLAALAAWLNTAPHHSTVLNSYTQFKAQFPEAVLKEPGVREAFRKALDMLNRSVDMDAVPTVPPPPPPPRFTPIDRIVDVIGSYNQQKSFSELLESRCVDSGITFVPIVGRSREGRPVYKIGSSLQCYVIRNVIMYSNDSGRTFSPISLDRLLKLAEE